jgi:hypothetical protein
MRRPVVWFLSTFILLNGATVVRAQDQNNPDVLKKELAEAMSQLKAAQDRKNELANEYEKLKAQVAAMQKQLDDVNRALAENGERTYAMRSQLAAWNAFLDRDLRLRARWELFLETPITDLTTTTGDWILESPRAKSLFEATTQPTTQPATQPVAATTPDNAPTTEPVTQPSSVPPAPVSSATTPTSPK